MTHKNRVSTQTFGDKRWQKVLKDLDLRSPSLQMYIFFFKIIWMVYCIYFVSDECVNKKPKYVRKSKRTVWLRLS